MAARAGRDEVFGFVRPALDAHTLGVFAAAQLLEDCGYRVVVADEAVCRATEQPEDEKQVARLLGWLAEHDVVHLAFSFRLEPERGVALFSHWLHLLEQARALDRLGGTLRSLHFAGLPEAARRIDALFEGRVETYRGDETAQETLAKLGVPESLLPNALVRETRYDAARMAFGRDLVARAQYFEVRPHGPGAYEAFGTSSDTLERRLADARTRGTLPLTRAHAGPYLPDREEAVRRFVAWARELGQAGFLDILSLGTSQLTQSAFGTDWGDRPNGGGVPVNSEAEFERIAAAARPMLVRTYAGTNDLPRLAGIYERTLSAAWHALSLWWFNRVDGRGPLSMAESLEQHVETIRAVAAMGRPFEANVAHHFAFRGGDDVSYVTSAVLGARVAKRLGIRTFVLQNMLNTPRGTWGIQDLAKSRALLTLTRELEDERFRVVLQPRAGLDLFSPDLDTARAQLAAVAALMDDIEPTRATSPSIVHVVSYSEASFLATPAVIHESIQITRHALERYRALRREGLVDDMTAHEEVAARTAELLADVRTCLGAIEGAIPDPLTPRGLYEIFAAGFLPVPYLWEGREELREAVRWPTRLVEGSVRVVDEQGRSVAVRTRTEVAAAAARARRA